MPACFPARSSTASRTKSGRGWWAAILDDPEGHGATAVFVAERDGAMIGFAACGPQRDEAMKAQGYAGQFGAIYVLRSHQRAGVGRTLMRMAARSLLDAGMHSACLWVLRENLTARAFYERLAGVVAGEKSELLARASVTELAYGWKNLSPLLR